MPVDIAFVDNTAAGILLVIRVDELMPLSGERREIDMGGIQAEIHDTGDGLLSIGGTAGKCKYCLRAARCIQPAERTRVIFRIVQRALFQTDFVQAAAIVVECIVHRIGHQVPAQLLVFIPFAELRQLIAHEVENLARMCTHI